MNLMEEKWKLLKLLKYVMIPPHTHTHTRSKYYIVFVDQNILCEQNVGLIMFFLKAQEICLPNMKHIISIKTF